MTPADHYRVRAAEFSALARTETNPELHLEYAKMAQSYLRLALLADRNSLNDIVYEAHVSPPENSKGAAGQA
jgi:hypothetical protein